MRAVFLSIVFSILSLSAISIDIDYSVSKQYNNIFSKNILSLRDIENYQKIFLLQKECKWKNANKYILELESQILMGHILAQRYLHPNCYKSKFVELTSWMKMYNDLPQAKRIYRLAIRRMPDGYRSPKVPISALGIKQDSEQTKKTLTKYASKKQLTKNQRSEKNLLISNIRKRVNTGWPTGALKLLNQKNTQKLLDSVEIDQQKEKIAKGYFLANKNELAIRYASEALDRSPNHVAFANWTAGLSAWRLQDYVLASEFFSNFSISQSSNPWHEASGAFWAARSFGKLKNYKEINFWLSKAAKHTGTFYGQLAIEILGIENPIDWADEKIHSDTEEIFYQLPAGKRIMALMQIGRVEEAESELIKLNKTINKSVAQTSLEVARKFNFARTQLKIANKLSSIGEDVPLKYFYPTPNWLPSSAYVVERALVFAFIHQESTFNKNAKSRKGAIGLMQIMPSTAKFISKNKTVKRGNSNVLKDPLINLEVGQDYIQYLLKTKDVNNNLIFMAAAYNGGPGNLKKWMTETNYSDDTLLFMESIPSRETRSFIENILTKYWIYKNQFNEENTTLFKLASGKEPVYPKKDN